MPRYPVLEAAITNHHTLGDHLKTEIYFLVNLISDQCVNRASFFQDSGLSL